MKNKNFLAFLFSIGGLIGFFFSFLITVEKFTLLVDPNYIPPCSINPFISCGTIMKSAQAAIFGFPNPILGIAGFAIVATIGFALLSGAQFKKWFWQGTQLGLLLALIFVYWLFSQSVFVIHALCPYCMAVWAVTIPLFMCTLVYNIKEKNLSLGSLGTAIVKLKAPIIMLMYGVIIISILIKFWEAFQAGI